MADLGQHRDYLEAEWQAARAAPLSLRRVLLVATLVDAYADRLFAAAPGADNILDFRAGLADSQPALGLVFDVCAQRRDGPYLALAAVEVPLADYGALTVEDFMVSLYSDHSVQRVVIMMPDGTQQLAHEAIGRAVEAIVNSCG